MPDILSQYCERFGEITTYGMPLSSQELQELLQKALEQDRPVNWISAIGYDPAAPLPEESLI